MLGNTAMEQMHLTLSEQNLYNHKHKFVYLACMNESESELFVRYNNKLPVGYDINKLPAGSRSSPPASVNIIPAAAKSQM